MTRGPSIVWFRADLRLDDNPSLVAAAQRGAPVIPTFVWAPEDDGEWPPGAASRWWLHQSLEALDRQLRGIGSRLVIRRGPAGEALCQLARQTGAGAIFWNRRCEPAAVACSAAVEAALRRDDLVVGTFNSTLLFEPTRIRTGIGKPYRVFTPFYKACLAADEPAEPIAAPSKLPVPDKWPSSEPLRNLQLEPRPDWAAGLRETWEPGAQGAMRRLEAFMQRGLRDYANRRDQPDPDVVSRLSAHLHFGEISPRTVWHAVRSTASGRSRSPAAQGPSAFLRQLIWREFAHHLLFAFPHTADEPLRAEFRDFPWVENDHALRAWQRGRTGYPFVDAGMRQLWHTGWMHNRVRMVVASFLVKDLLISWPAGALWFWDTLVDADLANNTFGWQWVAGCGADAAPFFRVFNPVAQGERFDPQGRYVRCWVPELAGLPAKWIHRPFEAPESVLSASGVHPGREYPAPIVDHAAARRRALAAFKRVRSTG